MQFATLLKMSQQDLDKEISKQRKKIKDAKETIQLLERLKSGAPENMQKTQDYKDSNSNQQDSDSQSSNQSNPYYGG